MSGAEPSGRDRARPARRIVGPLLAALLAAAGILFWFRRGAGERPVPVPARAQLALGEERYRSGDMEGALEAWQTATEIAPAWTAPYFRMAEALEEIGESGIAVQVLLRAADAAPRAPHVACRLARAWVMAEGPLEARQWANRAVTEEPDCPRGHTALALAGRGEPETALRHLRRARELAPADREVLLPLARLLAHSGRGEEARQILEPLLAGGPAEPEIRYLLGVALAARPGDAGAARAAEEHLNQVLRDDPDRWDALAQLGMLHARQRRWTRARPLLERARRLNPHAPGVLLQLGTVYRQLRDPRMAALWAELEALERNTRRWKALQERLALAPQNRELALETAELSLKVGAAAAASRLAREVLRQDPESRRARRVLERLPPAGPGSGPRGSTAPR